MQLHTNPSPTHWPALLARPTDNTQALDASVRPILDTVRAQGDAAVRHYSQQFDGIALDDFRVSAHTLAQAGTHLPARLKQAIAQAASNIRAFHAAQQLSEPAVETMPGVRCWRRSLPIERVGLYIPGGTAPLFSTVLMLGIPAALAGCPTRILCTPPDTLGQVHPAILYCAELVGITEVFAIGGVQAIAAMAYGTATVPQVHKLFGPGNAYVTAAKRLLAAEGVAIDMPAGPSEVMVIADDSANPAHIAADLLSQAEHGPDSQVMLISTSASCVAAVQQAIETQITNLPRQQVARQALAHSRAILFDSLHTCVAFANAYAAEHLMLNTTDAEELADQITTAGSVFIGPHSAESMGDYASGTNHTLPTNGHARAYSGVSLDSFVKKITYQHITPDGLRALGPVVEEMATAEQLHAHKQAVSLRLHTLAQTNDAHI